MKKRKSNNKKLFAKSNYILFLKIALNILCNFPFFCCFKDENWMPFCGCVLLECIKHQMIIVFKVIVSVYSICSGRHGKIHTLSSSAAMRSFRCSWRRSLDSVRRRSTVSDRRLLCSSFIFSLWRAWERVREWIEKRKKKWKYETALFIFTVKLDV